MKHTKGPWELIIKNQSDGIWGVIEPAVNKSMIAKIDCCNEEGLANANLISAAPDLYQASLELLSHLAENENYTENKELTHHMANLIIAINKAKGES